MRKITILFFLFLFATASFCQQEAPKTTVTHIDLLKKSKQQKAFAWVLAGTSAISFGIALATVEVELYNEASSGENQHSSDIIAGVGIACLTGSIILFVASAKNKKKAKAASAFFNMETTPVLQGTSIINQSFPVIGVKIKI